MASEQKGVMEELMCGLARKVYRSEYPTLEPNGNTYESFVRVLREAGLVKLLEAGADMRYQEWPEKMEYGPAKDWDAALEAFRKAVEHGK